MMCSRTKEHARFPKKTGPQPMQGLRTRFFIGILPGSETLCHLFKGMKDLRVMVGEDPRVFQTEIPEKVAVIGESGACEHIRVSGTEKHGHFSEILRGFGIEGGIEAVNGAFQLSADAVIDRKSTRLNSRHPTTSRMPSSA